MNFRSMRFSLSLLLPVIPSLLGVPDTQADKGAPKGCGSNIIPLYYNLCDLHAMWGVVVEALAATGVMVSFVLLAILLASLPFVTDSQKRSTVGLQSGFLVCTIGLFCLSFAFVVGQNFSTCMARRFLFGVLFAGSFSCLLMQAVRLNMLARWERGPPAWALGLGAMALWLVEVIINTEWLVLTTSYSRPTPADNVTVTCLISNQDFAMALIYVMVLLLVTLVAAVTPLVGKHSHWRRECAFLLATACISLVIWLAWLIMYVYGNRTMGSPSWDDPTLAVALLLSAWVFLILSSIPQIHMLTEKSVAKPECEETLYSNAEVTYENILKEQNAVSINKQACDNLYIENRAFSMEEPSQASKPLSPYSNYSGPVRSCVYQPTELALITKGLTNMGTRWISVSDGCVEQKDRSYESSIPRIAANPLAMSRSPAAEHAERTLPSVGPLHAATTRNLLHQTQW